MTYAYRGATFDAPEPAAPPNPKCGTRKGYRHHQNHRTPACDPCRAAHCAYMINYKKTRNAA